MSLDKAHRLPEMNTGHRKQCRGQQEKGANTQKGRALQPCDSFHGTAEPCRRQPLPRVAVQKHEESKQKKRPIQYRHAAIHVRLRHICTMRPCHSLLLHGRERTKWHDSLQAVVSLSDSRTVTSPFGGTAEGHECRKRHANLRGSHVPQQLPERVQYMRVREALHYT